MKRSKIIITFGALVLATGAFFFTKANKKFGTIPGKIVFPGGLQFGNGCLPFQNGVGSFYTQQTSSISTIKVVIKTGAGALATLVTDNGGPGNPLYYKKS